MVTRLTDEQMAHVREAFRVCDTDGDGLVTASDLRLFLLSFGRDYTETELSEFLRELPVNFEADGALDFPEFLLWTAKLAQKLQDESFERRKAEEESILKSIPKGALNESGARKREKVKRMRLEREQDEEATRNVCCGCTVVADDGQARLADARMTFDLFDVDKKGFISWEDLQRVASETGEMWPSNVVRRGAARWLLTLWSSWTT